MTQIDTRDTAAPVRATISNNYRWRLAVIGIGFTFFGLYCLYDGFYAWPKQKEVFDQYEAYLQEHSQAEWEAYATEHGLPVQPPKRTNFSIYSQYAMAAIVFPIGIIFTTGFIRSFTRFVEMDGTGLRATGGLQCRFDQLTGLDTRRWKTKGIAIVEYRDEAGATRRITLDDWKFDREATTAIYQRVASHLGVTEADAAAPAEADAQRPAEG